MAKKPSNDFGNKNPGNNAGSNANRPEAGHNSPNSGVPQSGSIGSQNNDLNNMNDQFANGQSMKHKPNSNKQPSRNGGLDDNGSSGSKGLGNAANNGGQNPNQNNDGIKDENTQPKKSIMGNTNAGGKGDKNEPEDDKGLFDKMSDLGHNAPQNFKALGSKIKSGYANFSDKATDKTLMVGQKLHWSMRRKTAKILIHALMIGGAGGGIIGLLYAGENNPLYAGYVCSTQNDNGDQYSGSDVNGTTGGLTDKGSKVYNLAKEVFIVCKKLGMNAVEASGLVGNMLNEGGGKGNLDELENPQDNQDGEGLYQFTGGTKTQYINWVKSSDAQKYGGSGSADPFGKNSVLLQTAGIMAVRIGGGSSSNGLKPYKAKNVSNPRDAAYQAYLLYENGNASTFTPSQVHSDLRQNDAVTAYNLFASATASIGPDASIADGNSVTAEQANDANCNNQSSTPQSDSNIVNIATQLMNYFSYSRTMRSDLAKNGDVGSIKSVSDVKKDGHADCSSFVWLVMKIAGKDMGSSPFATPEMLSDAQGAHKWFQEIPESQAKAGDVVITDGTQEDGHTGILAEDWHGKDTEIINEAQDTSGLSVAKHPYWWSFNSLLGSKPVFARIK